MNTADMTAKIAAGQGFIAALDQSGGSTPKALKGYGVDEGAWSNDEEMFGLIHEMRSRIIRSKAFTGDRVIGGTMSCGCQTPASVSATRCVACVWITQRASGSAA